MVLHEHIPVPTGLLATLLLIHSQHFIRANFSAHESSYLGQFSVCKTSWHCHKKWTWEGLHTALPAFCQCRRDTEKAVLLLLSILHRHVHPANVARKTDHPLEEFITAEALELFSRTASRGLSFTFTNILTYGLVLTLYIHNQGKTGKPLHKIVDFLNNKKKKHKVLCTGTLFKHRQPKHSQKKTSSC